MEDYYKILETNRDAVEYDIINNRKRTEKEKNEFLKGKYKDQIRLLKIRDNIARIKCNKDRLKELDQQSKAIALAYEQIKSSNLREKYHQKIDAEKTKEQENKRVVFNKKQPYEVLGINEKNLSLYTDKEIDDILNERIKSLLHVYSEKLDSIPIKMFSERMKINRKIQEIKEAYEFVKTSDRRKACDEQKQEQKQKENEGKIQKTDGFEI